MQISALYIYPIKSIGGISVKKAQLTTRGLAHDRRFMLTTPNGKFMTQRTNRQMALLRTDIQDERLTIWNSSNPTSKIDIPLCPTHFIKQQEVTIWGDSCKGQVLHKGINQWFSKQLNQACQLVYMGEDSIRMIDEKYRKAEEIVSFADAYPILLLGQAGLDDLNKKAQKNIPIDRFRANIIFTGGKPFEEDKWKYLKIGKQTFRGVKRCARCNVPNINQQTGNIDSGKEPNKTLATFRKFNGRIYVGQNICWEGKDTSAKAIIKVGEQIKKG